MLNSFLYLLIIGLLISCGQEHTDTVQYVKTAESVELLEQCRECLEMQNEFISGYNVNHAPIPIVFDELKTSRAGECYRFENSDGAYIKLDKSLWYKYTPHQRKALLMHEFGHCLLNLEHIDEESPVKDDELGYIEVMKKSLMHSIMMNPFQAAFFSIFEQEYMEALVEDRAYDYDFYYSHDDFMKSHLKDIEFLTSTMRRIFPEEQLDDVDQDALQEVLEYNNHSKVGFNEYLFLPYVCLGDDEIVYRNAYQASINTDIDCRTKSRHY